MKNSKHLIIAGILVAFFAAGGYTQYSSMVYANIDSNYKQVSDIRADMEDYVSLTRKKIKSNWYPPTSSFENTATISLTISKEGKLIDCRLSIPSEDEGFNNSLIEAAKKTVYTPLPDQFRGKSVELDLDFSMQRRSVSK